MTAGLIMGALQGGFSLGTGNKFFNFNSTFSTGTESQIQVTYRTAGTMSNLWIRVTTGTTTGSSTLTLRINGANGNETLSIAQGATGAFQAGQTDNIAAGDKINGVFNSGDNNIQISIIAVTFTPTTTSTSLSKCGYNSFMGGNTATFFMSIVNGGNNQGGSESLSKFRMRKSFTASNCCVNVSTNNSSSPPTIKSRKNGANGNIAVSPTANTTGIFEDTSHNDSLVSGDDYNYTFVTTDNQFQVGFVSIELTNSNGDICLGTSTDNNFGGATFNTSVTNYGGLAGDVIADTTESDMQVTINASYIFSQLVINIDTNSITSNPSATINLRANGGNTGVVISAINNQTGILVDNSHTYTSSSSDLMNYQIITGATGGPSMSYRQLAVNANFQSAAPGGGGPSYQHFDAAVSPKKKHQNYNSFGGQMIVFG